MHICFITHEYPGVNRPPGGGVGSFVQTVGRELVKQGHKVSVIGMNHKADSDQMNDNGVEVHWLPRTKIPRLTWWLNARKINKKICQLHRVHPIDIVETAELGLAFMQRISGIKYVIRLHGGHHFFAESEQRPINKLKGFQENRSFTKADAILAVSSYVAETTRNLLNLGDIKIEIVYNPINVDNFYQADHNIVKKHTIFFAGSIVEKKGIRQLILAIDLLVGQFPAIELIVAGRDGNVPGTGEPYRPILERSIPERVRKHIRFLGPVPNSELPTLIAEAQVCCYPSHMEAMPLAWLEALSMGKIFIGSKTGPGPEIITEYQNGLLVDPYNPKDIADKIKYVFLNYDDLQDWGIRARSLIVEKFDVKVMAKRNIEVYYNIINSEIEDSNGLKSVGRK